MSQEFDKYAGQYVCGFGEERNHHAHIHDLSQLTDKYVHTILQPLRLKPGRYLDMGAGTGEVGSVLECLFNGSCIVSDRYRGGLKYGEAETAVQADAVHQPFADQAFDFIHCKDTVVHVPDHEALMREIARLLRVGATALIVTQELAFNVATVYYSPSRKNGAIPFSFTSVAEYQIILDGLRRKVPEHILFGSWFVQHKQELGVDKAAQPLSLSPPYYCTSKAALTLAAARAGLCFMGSNWYRPDTPEEDWYDEERVVLEFEKK